MTAPKTPAPLPRDGSSDPAGTRLAARSEAGSAMFVAIVSLVVVAALATTMLGSVDSERRGVVIDNDRTQAMKFAEGVLEVAEDALLTHIANYQPAPTPPTNAPFQELSAVYTAGQLGATWEISKGTTTDSAGTIIPIAPQNQTDPMTGLRLTIEPHVLSTSVQVGTSSLRMRRYIETLKAPIFQFLSYYSNDLEILPGPAMTLSGRIHTNGDLYCAPGTSLSVLTNYLRTAHDFHRHRKDNTTLPAGWIKIQDASTGSLATLPSQSDMSSLGISSQWGLDSSFTGWDLNGDGQFNQPGEMPPFKNAVTSLFNGSFQTGEHGVQPLVTPSIGSIMPYTPAAGGDYAPGATPGTYVPVAPGTGTHAKGFFYENADLAIIGNQVYNKTGTNITALMPPGFITSQNLWDQRQNKTVTCTKVNLGKLGDMDGDASTKDPCPHYPANGLLYVARTDTTASQPNGVVLTNAAEINVPDKWNSNNYAGGATPIYSGTPPAGAYPFGASEMQGLTVVSPSPVYVHGNYNSKSKKPAAVITDAINMLSSAWDFTKTAGQVKTAANTTYNFAMITGNTNTTPGAYNGGFENLPRFHENWTGKTCTITGSFVNTWLSQYQTAPWVYGGAWYSAPIRVWSYDTMFDQGKLPPFTPMVLTARTVAWDVSN